MSSGLKLLFFLCFTLTLSADDLSIARAALRDRLYPVAERRAEDVLRKTVSGAQRREAALVLMEALAGQKKYSESVKRLQSLRASNATGSDTNAIPDFSYWQANALFEMGDYTNAVKTADSAVPVATGPTRDALLRLAARASCGAGNRRAAWGYFSRLDQISTNAVTRADNALEWAMALRADGQRPAALEVLKMQSGISASSSSMDEGMLLRGQLLLEMGRDADASLIFHQLAMNPHASERARVQALIEMSVRTLAQGKTNEAIAYARSAYSRAKEPVVRRFSGHRLGDLLMTDPVSRREGALLIRKLVREFPDAHDSMKAQLKLADSLLQVGEAKEAAAEYTIFLESYPSSSLDARVLEGRGWALLRLGRHHDACASFLQAAERFTDVDAKLECLMKAGDARMAGKTFREASRIYLDLLEQYPKSSFAPRATFQAADAFERAGEIEKAERYFRKVFVDYAGSEVASQAMLRVAALLDHRGDTQKAIETYSHIIDQVASIPAKMSALMGRGKIHYRNYRFEAAMQDFAAVAESDPLQRDEARFMLTVCLYGVGRDREARVAARAFLTDFPESSRLPDMTLWLAKFEFNHAQYAEARRLFQVYTTRWPEARWTDAAVLWGARSAFAENDFTGCIQGVTSLVTTSPKSPHIPEAYLLQADSLIELARFDEAVLLLDRVIADAPESDWAARAWLRKGDCLSTMGADNGKRYEEALDAYRKRLERGNVPFFLLLQIYFKIAWCYEKMEQPEEAIQVYYAEVMARYLEERGKGVWLNDATTATFIRSAFRAAEISLRQGKTDQALGILEQVAHLNVPGSDEARLRMNKILNKKAG